MSSNRLLLPLPIPTQRYNQIGLLNAGLHY
jgi:hypothetical protein